MSSAPSSVWIVPEASGGIRSYSETLLSALGTGHRGIWKLPSPAEVAGFPEPVVHIQHEFGLFGAKVPGLYLFPEWLKRARKAAPAKKFVATAHTVLDRDWSYRTEGRGWKALPLRLSNLTWVPAARKLWTEGTWKNLDATIVHSAIQQPVILESGCPRAEIIPHFVPESTPVSGAHRRGALVFGYFSPEKGQDVAIETWARLGPDAPPLVLAGGVRRREDEGYYRDCLRRIERHGLREKITVTGYVPPSEVAGHYARAELVIVPFRETSGSGSLAVALSHHAAILASALPLIREINEREPGCLAYFRPDSPEELAARARELLASGDERRKLSEAAARYARAHSPCRIAEEHVRLYRSLLGEANA
jgi:glycosyltransferase involved in cell wall biosynthesis